MGDINKGQGWLQRGNSVNRASRGKPLLYLLRSQRAHQYLLACSWDSQCTRHIQYSADNTPLFPLPSIKDPTLQQFIEAMLNQLHKREDITIAIKQDKMQILQNKHRVNNKIRRRSNSKQGKKKKKREKKGRLKY